MLHWLLSGLQHNPNPLFASCPHQLFLPPAPLHPSPPVVLGWVSESSGAGAQPGEKGAWLGTGWNRQQSSGGHLGAAHRWGSWVLAEEQRGVLWGSW